MDVHELVIYDNSAASNPYRIIARLRDGHPVIASTWPDWTPDAIRVN